MNSRDYEKETLNIRLKSVVGKRLGDIDTHGTFAKAVDKPKITGIAGIVAEQSIFDRAADNKQAPDIIVDGIPVEVKTTGLQQTKRGRFNIEAKEPMSVTAVTPENIISEVFLDSAFWHKLENVIFIYYLYDRSKVTKPKAIDYADFVIQGYDFHKFSESDRRILQTDWELVRDFIIAAQDLADPTVRYPMLSSELRSKLMYIDTAPKWPNRPRFRLKRSLVSAIAQTKMGQEFVPLRAETNSIEDLDRILNEAVAPYVGMTVLQISQKLGIKLAKNGDGKTSKSSGEEIMLHVFGNGATKLQKLDVFAKAGLIPKTIVTTAAGSRTEDMKLCSIDFDEWTQTDVDFEDSMIYEYFANHQFLFISFEEPHANPNVEENIFKGLQRITLTDEFIRDEVEVVWNKVRELISSHQLKEIPVITKNGDVQLSPKTKLPIMALNFPKSKDGDVFLRGSGVDGRFKPEMVNGIKMYKQYVWIKGKYLANLLK